MKSPPPQGDSFDIQAVAKYSFRNQINLAAEVYPDIRTLTKCPEEWEFINTSHQMVACTAWTGVFGRGVLLGFLQLRNLNVSYWPTGFPPPSFSLNPSGSSAYISVPWVTLLRTCVHHPQNHGLVVRFNQVLILMIFCTGTAAATLENFMDFFPQIFCVKPPAFSWKKKKQNKKNTQMAWWPLIF